MNKILIADDSALVRKVMCDIINADPDFQVTDTCADGVSALQKAKTGDFDVIVLEMNLSKMNAIQILDQMKASHIKTPVVILSSSLKEDADKAFVATGEGPLEVVTKPFRILSAEKATFEKQLLAAIRKFAKRCVPGRTQGNAAAGSGTTALERTRAALRREDSSPAGARRYEGSPLPAGRRRLLAIASSTGGPQALHTMLPMLPAHIGVPAVVVQDKESQKQSLKVTNRYYYNE